MQGKGTTNCGIAGGIYRKPVKRNPLALLPAWRDMLLPGPQ
jgi:hypothetical protein